MNNLVLFDFDGTITYSDSLSGFLKYYVGKRKYYSAKYLKYFHYYVAYYLGLIDYEKLKRYIIKYLLKGRDFEDISFYAKKYYDEKIMSDIKRSALVSLNKHKNSGDTIVIVSASLEIVLQYFCYQYGFDLIANVLIFKNGICVGEIEGKDCNGEEKVNRVRNKYNLKKHKHIYAYGDSEFDLPMLKIADYPNYRNFS